MIDLARLRDTPEYPFDIAPTEAEAQAIARLMDARSVRKLRFAGRLVPVARGGWRLEGKLGATVTQNCVVTLDPVTTRVDQGVRRVYLPDAAPAAAEVILSPDDDEEVDPLPERLDIGLVALEALALALPAYPRKEGAALADTGFAAEDEEVKPFAALAALRDKLGDGT
ncbi:DUF177 domain-containing protein [Amaricoccus solimangrovi]|uniref:DUF177 domain-containing protein n=1 Tax=Amaricoccus solimangrovi TaxID=2589815 RepID=A0A501WP07_9RHOB|nr:DUF177 domain-containing protein [Amaricoccus solimangrovi]